MREKVYEINKLEELEDILKEKLKEISESKLYITEEKLKTHLTENEILELLDKGILKDGFFK